MNDGDLGTSIEDAAILAFTSEIFMGLDGADFMGLGGGLICRVTTCSWKLTDGDTLTLLRPLLRLPLPVDAARLPLSSSCPLCGLA